MWVGRGRQKEGVEYSTERPDGWWGVTVRNWMREMREGTEKTNWADGGRMGWGT